MMRKKRLEKRKKDDDDIDQTPNRKHLRETATSNQKRQAARMLKRAKIADGVEFNVGDVVQVKSVILQVFLKLLGRIMECHAQKIKASC